MKLKFLYLLTVIVTFIFSETSAQQTAKITSNGIAYLQYLPDGYASSTSKYPLVISLHGVKERGTTSTVAATQLADVLRVANVGLPKYVKYGTKYPFILISPQLKTSYGNWPADYVIQVLNYVKTYLRVDDRRVYLTGLSLGGGGTWVTAETYPSVFAAIAPICGSTNILSKACGLASENVATWAFHGDADVTVNYQVSTKMVNAINACTPKPSPLAKITIYPGLQHVIWDKAYNESGVLNWMLSFVNGVSTPTTTNQAPIANAGGDITKTLPTNSCVLNGSGSDADGSITGYSWSQVSGPNTSALANQATASLSAASMIAGTYTFRLKVTDNKGTSSTDDVKVTVNAAATTTNVAPVANAGADKTILLPTKTVVLSGSGTDKDGSVTSYKWQMISGRTCSMPVVNQPSITIYGLNESTYVFKLTVTDNKGAASSDQVTVTVKQGVVTVSPSQSQNLIAMAK